MLIVWPGDQCTVVIDNFERCEELLRLSCTKYRTVQSGLEVGAGMWVSIFEEHQEAYLHLQRCDLFMKALLWAKRGKSQELIQLLPDADYLADDPFNVDDVACCTSRPGELCFAGERNSTC